MERPADPSSAELLARCGAGDDAAAAEVFRRYADRLTALARARLSNRLSRRVDAEDVALSAWRSFFAGAAAGRFSHDRGGDLWRLLASIALHKLCRQVRRHAAGRRDVSAERHFADLDGLAGREPTPDEEAAVADELASILRPLDPFARRVLELRL